MSDEEAEAYDLLNALQAQNDSRSGLDLDYGDDDLEEFEGEGGKAEAEGVDPKLLEAMEKNKDKYKSKEDDDLWEKISKSYMRTGLKRLVGKRRLKKKISSLKKKTLKAKNDLKLQKLRVIDTKKMQYGGHRARDSCDDRALFERYLLRDKQFLTLQWKAWGGHSLRLRRPPLVQGEVFPVE